MKYLKKIKENPSLMLSISNKKFFCEIVADLVVQTHLTCRKKQERNRWVKAIAKAAAVILEGDTTFLHWDPNRKILFFWSPESNEIYQSGETCQCPAFLQSKPQPCYHRAMSRLVQNYFEFRQKPGESVRQIDFADAIFFDEELSARQKVELLNLSILEGRVELKPRVEALQKYVTA